MADKNSDKTKDGKEEGPTFHVYSCPQSLIDRVKAKAALKGKGVSEWVVEVLERETKKLKPLQDEYNAEE